MQMRATLLFAFCLFAASPAYAQTQITINPGASAPQIDNEAAAQQEIDTIPGNASVVDDSQWSNQRASTIKDVASYIPGVFDEPRDGAESDRLSIRGSGLADIFQGRGLLVMQDGIPITAADGEFEFPTIEPWLIRYAEVFPGANAMQFGSSTFGGALNFITPNGITDPGYDIRAEAGGYGTVHGQFSAGKSWENGDMFAAATGFMENGFRQQDEQDTSRFNGNAGWLVGNDFFNRVYISHTHSDAEIPGAITLADVDSDPRLANPLNLSKNYQRDLDITRIADKSAWVSGDDRFDSTVYYTYRELNNPVTTYEFQDSDDMGMRLLYTHTFDLNKWMLGLNSAYGDADEKRYADDAAIPGTHILNRMLYAETSEAYTEYEQHIWQQLYGIADLQESLAMRDIHQGFPYVASQNEEYAGFNPRIGLRYDLTQATQLYTNLSRSFEPPTWNELSGGNSPGFNLLKAQRSTTAETGVRAEYDGMHFAAAYYHAWVRDEFVDYYFPDGSTATINAARTEKDGVELGMNGDVKKNLFKNNDAVTLRVAYTFSKFNLDGDPVYNNNQIPGVPEHYIRAETLYRYGGFSAGPNVEWSPKPSPIDLANTLYAPAYAIYGLRASWESEDKNTSFYIEGRNIFNTNYVATYNVVPNASGQDGAYFYPGEGHALYAGMRLKL